MASHIGVERLRMEAETLRDRLAAKQPTTVLDARGAKAWEWSNAKIPGAIRVDEENFVIDPAWPRDQCAVVYSADLHDATSGMVALKLSESGFNDVYVLRGGFEAWDAVNGPVEGK